MTSLCPRCLQDAETNVHVYCCLNEAALKQRKKDWLDLWKALHRCKTATVIEQTWQSFLQPILGITQGGSIVDTIPVTHGDVTILLQQAIHEQSIIGWDKLLLGMGSEMRREARQQAKDRSLPSTPRRARSRAVQIAVKEMREKLYAAKADRRRHPKCPRKRRTAPSLRTRGQQTLVTGKQVSTADSMHPPLHLHPP